MYFRQTAEELRQRHVKELKGKHAADKAFDMMGHMLSFIREDSGIVGAMNKQFGEHLGQAFSENSSEHMLSAIKQIQRARYSKFMKMFKSFKDIPREEFEGKKWSVDRFLNDAEYGANFWISRGACYPCKNVADMKISLFRTGLAKTYMSIYDNIRICEHLLELAKEKRSRIAEISNPLKRIMQERRFKKQLEKVMPTLKSVCENIQSGFSELENICGYSHSLDRAFTGAVYSEMERLGVDIPTYYGREIDKLVKYSGSPSKLAGPKLDNGGVGKFCPA